MKKLLTVIPLIISITVFGQDNSDVIRLKQMDYMKYASAINCDSTSGTNLEHRICLNLEFQKLDSLMNDNFRKLLTRTDNDSIKNQLKENQQTWVNNRRLQSEIISRGYQGHSLGITYLQCMIEATRSRNIELTEILKIE